MEDYLTLFNKLDHEGLSEKEFDWLLSEARRRSDAPRETLLLLCRGDEDAALKLARTVGPDETLVNGLAKWVDADTAWHALFTIAETSPTAFQSVDNAIRHWSASARLMPHSWWAAILHGNFAPHHQLARQIVIKGEDSRVLLRDGASVSLRGITSLGLEKTSRKDLLRIFELDWLENVTELELLDLDCIPSELAKTCAFPKVRTLALRRCTATPESIADLIVGSSFPELKCLELSVPRSDQPTTRAFDEQLIPNPLELDRISTALAGRKIQRNPFELVLTGLGVDSTGIRELAAQPALAKICGLAFLFSVISSDDVAVLAQMSLSLQRFELHLGEIGPQGAAALAEASWLRTLRHLALPGQNIGDIGMANILRCLDGGPIEIITVSHNKLGTKTAQVLATVSLPKLKTLDLNYNAFDDLAIKAVIENPTFGCLESLELLGTGVSTLTAQAISTVRHLTHLRILSLGDHVGDAAATCLKEAHLPELKRLQLRGVSDDAVAALEQPGRYVTNSMFA